MNATTTYDHHGIKVHPDCLRALLMFLGQDETRPMLMRVFLDEEGHLTATDGTTIMRLSSIDPGGCVPGERAGTQWSRETVEAAIKTAHPVKGKHRAQQHAQLRVYLRWDAVVHDQFKSPPSAHLVGLARDCKKKPDQKDGGRGGFPGGVRADGWSMQARYMARLASASLLLTGSDCMHRGPALVNNPRPLDPMLFELPWYEPVSSDPKITYLDPSTRPVDTFRVPEPDHAAEVVIMPLRL